MTLALVSIVISTIFSFQLFGNKILNKGIDQVDVQSNLRLASDFIISDLRNATEIKLTTPTDPSDYHQVYVSGHRLVYQAPNGTSMSKTDAIISNPTNDLIFGIKQIGSNFMLDFSIKGTSQTNTYSISSEVLLNNIKEGTTSVASSRIYYKKGTSLAVEQPTAELSSITTDFGTLVPTFNSIRQSYVVEVPFGTIAVPMITGVAKAGSTITSTTQATTLTGTTTINVSMVGGLEATYTVSFLVEDPPVIPPVVAIVTNVFGSDETFTIVFGSNIESVIGTPANTSSQIIGGTSVKITRTDSGKFTNNTHYSITVKPVGGLETVYIFKRNGSNWNEVE